MDSNEDQEYPGLSNVDGGTIWSQLGQSFSQSVDLADVNSSLALLPVGNAENPQSAFFGDQGSMWVTGTLRSATLTAPPMP